MEQPRWWRRILAGVGSAADFGKTWLTERKALGVGSARDEDNSLTRHVYPSCCEDTTRFGGVRPPHDTARGNSLKPISKNLARHTGFEPVAYGFGGRRSIQLS